MLLRIVYGKYIYLKANKTIMMQYILSANDMLLHKTDLHSGSEGLYKLYPSVSPVSSKMQRLIQTLHGWHKQTIYPSLFEKTIQHESNIKCNA